MFFVNSGKTESQIANVVPGKYSNRDFESAHTALINLNRLIIDISIQSENGRIPFAERG